MHTGIINKLEGYNITGDGQIEHASTGNDVLTFNHVFALYTRLIVYFYCQYNVL